VVQTLNAWGEIFYINSFTKILVAKCLKQCQNFKIIVKFALFSIVTRILHELYQFLLTYKSYTFQQNKHCYLFYSGDYCRLGQYCESGSSNGTGCSPGTFLNVTGGQSISDCLSCTAGSYCSGYGNVDPTGLCDPGYYCPGSVDTSQPLAYQCLLG
jgi:hypothetical protein